MKSKERIFLIGFMGAGKSTLGRALAHSMNYSFVDTDDLIVQKEGRSISNIFKIEGESYFRIQEKKAIERLCKRKKIVIATGGGMPCFLDNMTLIQSNGLSIFIELTADSLLTRLKHEKEHRPLLNEKDDEMLLSWINEKLTERNVYYHQADIILDGQCSIEALVNQIKRRLDE